MKTVKIFITSLVLILALQSPVQAKVATILSKETACQFDAFSLETDPKGLNVRSGPGESNTIIAKLPPRFKSLEYPGYESMVEVEVIGVKHGWFKIRNASDNGSLMGAPERPMYTGTGWVSGKKLTVKSQADAGYASPDEQAPVLVDTNGSTLDSLVENGVLVDCKDRWAKIDVNVSAISKDVLDTLNIQPGAYINDRKGHFQIWVNKICGLQETSCSGFEE